MKALVVSGGGAKFWYSAGALHTLKKRGHEFDRVYGASTGAISTLLWMQGDPKRAWEIAGKITPSNIIKESFIATKLHRFARARPLADNSPMVNTLMEYFPRHSLDFSFKSYAIATNIVSQERKVFHLKEDDPDLYRYVVASCAIPALVQPVNFTDDLICIDGQSINNCLLTPAVADGATEIILIVLSEKTPSRINPDNLFELISSVAEGTLNHSVARDLLLTDARNKLPGFRRIKVQLIRPSRKVPIEFLKWTPVQAREAFDMGSTDAMNMETIIDPTRDSTGKG